MGEMDGKDPAPNPLYLGSKLKHWIRTIILVALLGLFLTGGGYVVKKIENSYRKDHNRKVAEERSAPGGLESLLQNASDVFNTLNNITADDLRQFYTTCNQLEETTRTLPMWTLADGIYYWMEVSTTIGYGDTVCRSRECRIMTMVFGIFGIALSGLLIRELAVIIKGICRVVMQNFSPKEKNNEHHPCRAALKTGMLIIFGLSMLYFIFLFLPAWWLQYKTDWNWLTAHYFLFVTFTTIGFGDYTLKELSSTYGIVWMMFMYIGVAALASTIGLIAERITVVSDEVGTRLRANNEKDRESDSDNDSSSLSSSTQPKTNYQATGDTTPIQK